MVKIKNATLESNKNIIIKKEKKENIRDRKIEKIH